MKDELSIAQLDILKLLFLQQYKRMTCHHMILHVEELRNKYSDEEVIDACKGLQDMSLIVFTGSNGCIASPEALAKTKKIFPVLNIAWHFRHIFGARFYKSVGFVWDNLVVRVLVPVLVGYILIVLDTKP